MTSLLSAFVCMIVKIVHCDCKDCALYYWCFIIMRIIFNNEKSEGHIMLTRIEFREGMGSGNASQFFFPLWPVSKVLLFQEMSFLMRKRRNSVVRRNSIIGSPLRRNSIVGSPLKNGRRLSSSLQQDESDLVHLAPSIQRFWQVGAFTNILLTSFSRLSNFFHLHAASSDKRRLV